MIKKLVHDFLNGEPGAVLLVTFTLLLVAFVVLCIAIRDALEKLSKEDPE